MINPYKKNLDVSDIAEITVHFTDVFSLITAKFNNLYTHSFTKEQLLSANTGNRNETLLTS